MEESPSDFPQVSNCANGGKSGIFDEERAIFFFVSANYAQFKRFDVECCPF